MYFKNTSRYPDDEVLRLVRFGMKGIATAKVAVNVKNAENVAYRGAAYFAVPRRSPLAAEKGIERLVTIGIGRETQFPTDNMTTSRRWVPLPDGEPTPGNPACVRTRTKRVEGRALRIVEHLVEERHPYGGKSSPLVQMADWREALVAVAAHEARHLQQFRHKRPLSEVDCEKFAAFRLDEFREAERRGRVATRLREIAALPPPPVLTVEEQVIELRRAVADLLKKGAPYGVWVQRIDANSALVAHLDRVRPDFLAGIPVCEDKRLLPGKVAMQLRTNPDKEREAKR